MNALRRFILVALLALCAGGAAYGIEYQGGSKLNMREEAGQPQPELGRIGCIWLMGGQAVTLSNRGVFLIDPSLSDAERAKHAAIGGVYASAHEFFRGRVDPATAWLEGNVGDGPAPWLAIHDFERWCGNVGDQDRYFDSNEMRRSLAAGKTWLVDGMLECGSAYADAGRQVIFHSGCPDSANYAGDLIKMGRSAELMQSLHETYHPLVVRGIGVGMDNAGAQPENSLTYTTAKSLALMRAFVQVEATPDLKQTQWHGYPCRCVYDEFIRRHVKQEPWAVGRYAVFGTKQFAEIHPDCRVSIFPSHASDAKRIDGTDDERRAYLADVAAMTKPLVAGGVRVLLHERIVFEASRLGVSVKEMLP